MLKRLSILMLIPLLLAGCACTGGRPEGSASLLPSPSATARPSETAVETETGFTLPQGLEGEGTPTVTVYVAEEKASRDMDIETYLQGVLAGEMQADWPLEALKAQAILARTYAVRFIADGGSRYEGADVSTDIEEAQAYDEAGVNDRIRQAIEETRGQILVHGGEAIYAWFHAHSGGVTATAKEGLAYEKAEPPYIQSVPVEESGEAPSEARSWTADIPLSEVQTALDDLGGGEASALKPAEYGPSGRVTAFDAGGVSVSAPALRLALDGARFRSTLLTACEVEGETLHLAGRGYGHGVGLSQWGAYALAQNGKNAAEIIATFFKDVELITAWA